LSFLKTDVDVKMSVSIEEAANSDRKTVRSLALTMVGFALLTIALIVAALVITEPISLAMAPRRKQF
jgi:hypothetical protein